MLRRVEAIARLVELLHRDALRVITRKLVLLIGVKRRRDVVRVSLHLLLLLCGRDEFELLGVVAGVSKAHDIIVPEPLPGALDQLHTIVPRPVLRPQVDQVASLAGGSCRSRRYVLDLDLRMLQGNGDVVDDDGVLLIAPDHGRTVH